MTTQILSLLVFQALHGYIYRELALLIGTFMVGMALGTWSGIVRVRPADAKRLRRWATGNQLLLACSAPLLLTLVSLLSGGSGLPTGLSGVWFPAVSVLCGVPCGYQFSIGSAIYQQDHAHKPGSGGLYAFDLLGGCGGALVLAAFLIPLLGFWRTAWLSTVIGLAAALMLALARSEELLTLSPEAGAPQTPQL